MDYKANVDARSKAELPELACKTTYLYFGYYPQNMAYFPSIKPVKWPGTSHYVQMLATNPESRILVAGDLTVNPGIWVRQTLATGAASFGKYANVALERLSFQQMLDKWSEIAGKQGVLVQVSEKAWTDLWGPVGTEVAWQFKFGELCDPWAVRDDFISPEELGINPSEVMGFRDTIRGLARKGMFD